MDMGNLMGGFMGMTGMGNMGNMGMNPFLQFLNQSGLHPNWAAGLPGAKKKIYIFFLVCLL